MTDIVISGETLILIGRLATLAFLAAVAWFISFKQTPELEGIKNAWLYRVSYGLMILRGFCFVTFETLKLFP